MDAAPLFLLTSLVLVGSPGPNTLSLASLGAAFGARRGLPYMLGLNLGMVGVVALVGSGLSAIVMSFPGVAPVVTLAATAYLIFLAYRIATAPSRHDRKHAPHRHDGRCGRAAGERWRRIQ